MLRNLESEWWICYDADGKKFDGPFASEQLAAEAVDQLKPVDRALVACKGPYLRTDVEFLKDSENGRQFQGIEYQGDIYKKNCEKHGGSTTGKKYLHQLAKFPGDPKAWISSRGDVERVAKERGLGVEGLVDVPTPEVEPPEPVAVAKDILEREMNRQLACTRGFPEKKKAELKEAIIDKISFNKK